MRLSIKLLSVMALCAVASCDVGTTIAGVSGDPGLRVVNAITSPVDVLIDGNVAIASLAPGTIGTAAAPRAATRSCCARRNSRRPRRARSRRPTALSPPSPSCSRRPASCRARCSTTRTASSPPARRRSASSISRPTPARSRSSARSRTFQTPIAGSSRSTTSPTRRPSARRSYQSTGGTWEVRVWQTPADSSGWSNAPVKVHHPARERREEDRDDPRQARRRSPRRGDLGTLRRDRELADVSPPNEHDVIVLERLLELRARHHVVVPLAPR